MDTNKHKLIFSTRYDAPSRRVGIMPEAALCAILPDNADPEMRRTAPSLHNERRIFWSLLLLIVFLFNANLFAEEKDKDCSCACRDRGALEIAFILDVSGSMHVMLNTLQEQVKYVAKALQIQVKDLRMAVVLYRTEQYRGKFQKLDFLQFTANRKELSSFLAGQKAQGGGDELIEDALKIALERLRWTKGSRKVAVLLGDEQPRKEKQAACMRIVREMQKRGIVFNAVTASQTAWQYFINVNKDNWRSQLQGLSQKEKRIFELPRFKEMAELGGGISVSSWNSRELILQLLAFGLGLTEQDASSQIDVGKFLEWSQKQDLQEKQEAQQKTAVVKDDSKPASLIGRLKHHGKWDVPLEEDVLFSHLGTHLNLTEQQSFDQLELLSPGLKNYPVLYLTSYGKVKWVYPELQALRLHLHNGGFLFADAACGCPSFFDSVKKLFKDIFPDTEFRQLDSNHPIFSVGHNLKTVKRSEQACSGNLRKVPPELHGLFIIDKDTGVERLAVVVSPYDISGSWAQGPLSTPVMHSHEDSLKLAANIFFVGLNALKLLSIYA